MIQSISAIRIGPIMILNKHSNVKTRGIIKGGMFGGMGKWTYWPRIYEYQMYKSVSTDAKCDPKHNLIFFRFLFVGFSSVIIVFSVVSLVFSLMFLPTSGHCGPFIRQQHIADVFVKELDGLPSVSDISKSTTTTYILVILNRL